MTDEQFIEKVRRDLGRSKTISICLFVILAFAFIAAIWIAIRFIDTVRDLDTTGGNIDKGFILGLLLGATISLMFISLAHTAFQSIMMAIGKGYAIRTMKLLVKYYDKDQKAEQGAAANP